MLRKGIAYTIEQLFTLTLAGILAVSFSFILPGQVTKVQPAIEQKDIENNAILITNSLRASPILVSSSNGINHLGVFDSSKLNVNMIEKSSAYENILSCSNLPAALCNQKLSKEGFILVLVSDTENGKGWFSVLKSGSKEFLDKTEKCLKDVKRDSATINKLFEKDSDLSETLKLKEARICGFTLYSNIMDRGYAVSITYPDGSSHVGLIRVLVVQEPEVKQ